VSKVKASWLDDPWKNTGCQVDGRHEGKGEEPMTEAIVELDRTINAPGPLDQGDSVESREDSKPRSRDGASANEALAGIQRRVRDAVNCEAASHASFVARAELALYLSVEGDEPATRLTDLLCHLRHWAEANAVDFEAASRDAAWHHTEEWRGSP
jgi:hypothetical protein